MRVSSPGRTGRLQLSSRAGSLPGSQIAKGNDEPQQDHQHLRGGRRGNSFSRRDDRQPGAQTCRKRTCRRDIRHRRRGGTARVLAPASLVPDHHAGTRRQPDLRDRLAARRFRRRGGHPHFRAGGGGAGVRDHRSGARRQGRSGLHLARLRPGPHSRIRPARRRALRHGALGIRRLVVRGRRPRSGSGALRPAERAHRALRHHRARDGRLVSATRHQPGRRAGPEDPLCRHRRQGHRAGRRIGHHAARCRDFSGAGERRHRCHGIRPADRRPGARIQPGGHLQLLSGLAPTFHRLSHGDQHRGVAGNLRRGPGADRNGLHCRRHAQSRTQRSAAGRGDRRLSRGRRRRPVAARRSSSELERITTAVLEEEAEQDDDFAAILASQNAFRSDYAHWKALGYLPRDF